MKLSLAKITIIYTIVSLVFLLSIVITGFYYQLIFVQGSSMSPTLEDGNVILIEKEQQIQRDNIIVFEKPDYWVGEKDNYIKRIIAIPGDTVRFTKDNIIVNNEHYYPVHNSSRCAVLAFTYQVTIPEGKLFVAGDNYKNSYDSREHVCLGAGNKALIPTENIITGNIKISF